MYELELIELGEVSEETMGQPIGGFYEKVDGVCALSKRATDADGCGPVS